jgi:hypothetical protein
MFRVLIAAARHSGVGGDCRVGSAGGRGLACVRAQHGSGNFRRSSRRWWRDGRGGRRRRPSLPGRRTRRNAPIVERLLPRIRVIDPVHPLFGQPLEVSPSGLIRRIGWIRVVLPDGRHRWIPQKATDLNVSACEARPNRDLPRVSVRTLIPLAEYVRARLSALRDPTWTAGRDFAIENGRNAGG